MSRFKHNITGKHAGDWRGSRSPLVTGSPGLKGLCVCAGHPSPHQDPTLRKTSPSGLKQSEFRPGQGLQGRKKNEHLNTIQSLLSLIHVKSETAANTEITAAWSHYISWHTFIQCILYPCFIPKKFKKPPQQKINLKMEQMELILLEWWE